MISQVGRMYIRALMAVEVILLIGSIVMHISVLAGNVPVYLRYHGLVGSAIIIFGGASFPFKRKNTGILAQIKSCPGWLWRPAIGLAAYGIMTLIILAFDASSQFTSSFVGSGFTLGFIAVPICILYPWLWRFSSNTPELIRSTGISFIFMSFGIIWATSSHLSLANR